MPEVPLPQVPAGRNEEGVRAGLAPEAAPVQEGYPEKGGHVRWGEGGLSQLRGQEMEAGQEAASVVQSRRPRREQQRE